MKYSLQMRLPGVEPGAQAWEACMLPLHYRRSCKIGHLNSNDYPGCLVTVQLTVFVCFVLSPAP